MYGLNTKRQIDVTEDFPTFTQPLPVICVDNIHDGMTVAIVSMPDRAYASLATQVPELEDRGGERYRASCPYVC